MQFQGSCVSKALAAAFFFSCVAQGALLDPPVLRVHTARSSQRISDSPRWTRSTARASCRYLPGDTGYPTEESWNTLNDTVVGKLIRGIPLANVCHGTDIDDAKCSSLEEDWSTVNP